MPRNPGHFAARRLDVSVSARALYGAELRYYRERAGMTLQAVADRLHITMPFLARIEQGERRLPPELTAIVDELLDAGDFFTRNEEAGQAPPPPDRLRRLEEWEARAAVIREWDAVLVPGLLQTDGYAKAVARVYGPALADRVTRHRWEARLSRTPLLTDPRGPRYLGVLGEAALRRPLGGVAVMAGQLAHLAGLVRSGRVTLRVLPLTATPHPAGTDGALRVMTYDDDTPTLHFTAHRTGSHLTDPAAVNLAHLTHDLLTAAALPEDGSLALIEEAAAAYRTRARADRKAPPSAANPEGRPQPSSSEIVAAATGRE